MVKRYLYLDTAPTYYRIPTDESIRYVTFDIEWQLQLLLCRYIKEIRQYRDLLRSDNGDILGGYTDVNQDVLVLHLHLSTDGGQLYRFKKSTIWPVHCTVLDLPLNLRTKRENIIVLGLWEGRQKPQWSQYLSIYLKNSCLGKPIELHLGNMSVKILPKVHSAVFDLPAAATVLNHHQFNGKFGCIYCCAAGVVVKTGKGHSRKYGEIYEALSDDQYKEFSELASLNKETIFGIKGKSCLSEYLAIPSHVLLDPLHLLFENCSKSMICKLIDSSSYRESYFLGRHVDSYDKLMETIRYPAFMSRPISLRDLSFWKARDYMHFLFYYSIPTIVMSLYYKPFRHNEYAFHFLSFIFASKMCYGKTVRSSSSQIRELFRYFHSKLYALYDVSLCTINMHQLLHLADQVQKFGALPFCSMFSFESQFKTLKLYTQGTKDYLKQICTKFSLLKLVHAS